MEKRIRVTYEIITPESAEMGDAEDRGWEDEGGHDCTPDKWDVEDGLTAVDIAVGYLQDNGAVHASSSCYHRGVWYSTSNGMDMDGTVTDYSYHFAGEDWTEGELKAIYAHMTR